MPFDLNPHLCSFKTKFPSFRMPEAGCCGLSPQLKIQPRPQKPVPYYLPPWILNPQVNIQPDELTLEVFSMHLKPWTFFHFAGGGLAAERNCRTADGEYSSSAGRRETAHMLFQCNEHITLPPAGPLARRGWEDWPQNRTQESSRNRLYPARKGHTCCERCTQPRKY